MQCIRTIAILALILTGFVLPAQVQAGQTLTLASGAGYKRLVEELCAAFTKQSGIQTERLFGNMGQITAQAKASETIDMIIGDKKFLDATDLPSHGEQNIGKGRLVAAFAKESAVTSLDRLTDPAITRIAMPDGKKAIYGQAAREYLTAAGVWDKVQPKLLVAGTVPQVSTYVVTGEVDVGFINLTEARAITDKVGKTIVIDEQFHTPILIVARHLKAGAKDSPAALFSAFLQSAEARQIIDTNGLQ